MISAESPAFAISKICWFVSLLSAVSLFCEAARGACPADINERKNTKATEKVRLFIGKFSFKPTHRPPVVDEIPASGDSIGKAFAVV
jgi:hypothetical protein